MESGHGHAVRIQPGIAPARPTRPAHGCVAPRWQLGGLGQAFRSTHSLFSLLTGLGLLTGVLANSGIAAVVVGVPSMAAQSGGDGVARPTGFRPNDVSLGVEASSFPEGEWQFPATADEISWSNDASLNQGGSSWATETAPEGHPAGKGWWPWAHYVGWSVLAGLTAVGIERLVRHWTGFRTTWTKGPAGEHTRRLIKENAELARRHQLELDGKVAALQAADKANLTALRYQLDPHFLFNVLTSISASLPSEDGPARGMVEHLADFYRLTLPRGDGGEEWTTLGEEIELLRTYFAIERARWGELLDVQVALDPGLKHERIPHFLLLPLVEIPVKYGRATSSEQIGVRLVARRVADTIIIEVANTGQWIEPAAATRRLPSLGVGLANVRQRLARHYPGTHDLGLSHADGWVAVSLRLAA